jgi:hypothetical protein
LASAVVLALATCGLAASMVLGWLLVAVLAESAEPGTWLFWSGEFLARIGLGGAIVLGGLWLFAVVDAWRVATALRRGELVVRYSFFKQAAHLAVGSVPIAGCLAPEETCAADELAKPVGKVVIERAAARYFGRFLKISLALFGILPVLIGSAAGLPVLVVLGALVVVGGIVLSVG